MALLAAIATGSATDFTSSGTWALVDPTSLLNSETGSEVLTTAYSGTRTSAFTPGAITIDGIGVKLSVRTGTTGTISVNLEKDSDDSQVSGTEVTINCSDLPAAVTADANGGWVFFNFAAPVLLVTATAYQVAAKTSSATQVSLFRDGTTDNFSRYLRTTTTQAPTTGDDLIIAREWTAAATNTAAIVTLDNTASTDFGAASTSLVTPGLAICDGGTLISGVTAATAYLLKLSGNLIVYAGGTLSLGTSGTRIPEDSTCTITFDCGANVDFGLTIRNLGIMNGYGHNGRTVSTLLNTDEAASATVIGVASTSGWRVSDVLAFASTTRTASECESKIIQTVDSSTQVTLTAGLTNAHSGTSPTQAEVLNLTRNVLIQGASASLQAFVDIKATAVVNLSYMEFKWLGSATALKRGVDIATTTGTFVADKCSFHDFSVAGSIGLNQTGTSGQTTTTLAITAAVVFNTDNYNYQNIATTGAWSLAGGIFMRTVATTSAGIGLSLGDCGGILDNVSAIGHGSTSISLSETAGVPVSASTITAHSGNGAGMSISCPGTLGPLKLWRNTGNGAILSGLATIISGLEAFGNSSAGGNIGIGGSLGNPFGVKVYDAVLSGDSTFSTSYGIQQSSSGRVWVAFYNCTLGVVSGIKTAHATGDIQWQSTNAGVILLNNCLLASTTDIFSPSNIIDPASGVFSQRHDQTNGVHKSWVMYGILSTDTTIYNTASPSMRMTPSSASGKLMSGPLGMAMKYAGDSGATITISVKVRKSVSGDGAAYNGNQPRLIVRRNDAVGIAADTVLATASGAAGSFETLSGTTATLSDDGAVEVYVDCDGTVGWVNVDDWGV